MAGGPATDLQAWAASRWRMPPARGPGGTPGESQALAESMVCIWKIYGKSMDNMENMDNLWMIYG